MTHNRTFPFSLEKVRRQVLLNLHVIEKQVNRFIDDHLKHVELLLHDQLDDFLDALLGKLTPTTTKTLITVSQCRDILESARYTKNIHSRSEYPIVTRIVCAALAFQQLTQVCHKLALHSYNEGLKKYCVSFFADSQGCDLVCVQNYESFIQERSAVVETLLRRQDAVLCAHDKLSRDVRAYCHDYEKVVTVMSEFCDVVTQLQEPLKEWVFADRDYIPQLLEESEALKQQLSIVRRGRKLSDHDCTSLARKLQRKTWQRQNLESAMTEEKNKLKTQRERQKLLQADVEQRKTLLQSRLQELGECKQRQTTKKKVSFIQADADRLSQEVNELSDRINGIQRHLRELEQDNIHLRKTLHANRDVLTRLSHDEQSMQSRLRSINNGQLESTDYQKQLEARIQALKRIRFIKLHPDTVGKIRQYGYLPHATMDEELVRAFRAVSEKIGRQWSQLYLKLPFRPERDRQARTSDLTAIGRQTEQVEYPVDQAVYQCLEKWYRLSHSASLTQLLTTLKRINRSDVADHVSNVTQHGRAMLTRV